MSDTPPSLSGGLALHAFPGMPARPRSRTEPALGEAVQCRRCGEEFTASRREGGERVEVADPALLPDPYVRTRREPDKAALLAALKAGDAVPGAVLARSEETLTVRTK